MKRYLFFFPLPFFLLAFASYVQAQTICKVGNATGNDTAKIQAAINSCAGGGEVKLSSGKTYTAGTIVLKSGVTLNLNGAILETSAKESDFQSISNDTTRITFVGADKGTANVVIVGPGMIKKSSQSDFEIAFLRFVGNTNLTLKNFEVNSLSAPPTAGGFHITLDDSDGVLLDEITVRGRRGGGQVWGNDGIDVRSRNVTIRNCDVNTHDDGIVIATPEKYPKGVSNVTVENCRVSSDSSALKFGTGTHHDINNVTFDKITIYDGAGIRFSVYDGAELSNVIFSNITYESNMNYLFACGGGASGLGIMKDCAGPVDRDGDGIKETAGGYIRDIVFEDFDIFDIGSRNAHGEASLNTMDRVTFKNIRFHSGSGSPPLARFRNICGLSISNITYPHPTIANPQNDLNIEVSVTNVRYDGGAPVCGGALPTSTSTPTKEPSPMPTGGDLDSDGDVDIFDYNALVENFGASVCGNIADIDGNCKVDIFDYNILVENFGR
ncbi:hypothetical protein IID21_00300 [Patescibacteria group bacterium]|nr:hypothetical protein [Patescibacteria group bacterium]